MSRPVPACGQHSHVVIVNPSTEPVGRIFTLYGDALAFFHDHDEAVIACAYDENGNLI